jgi:hypothetical protein
VIVDHLQAVHCTGCGKWYEVPKQILRDPAKRVDYLDTKKQQHKDCKPKLGAMR